MVNRQVAWGPEAAEEVNREILGLYQRKTSSDSCPVGLERNWSSLGGADGGFQEKMPLDNSAGLLLKVGCEHRSSAMTGKAADS